MSDGTFRLLSILLAAAALGLTGWLLFGPDREEPLESVEDVEVIRYERQDDLRVAEAPIEIRYATAAEMEKLDVEDDDHKIPQQVEDHRIVHPSGAEWTLSGKEFLGRLTQAFPGLPIVFQDESAQRDFEQRSWPTKMPSHVHFGLIVTSFPDLGFKAMYRDDILYVVRTPDDAGIPAIGKEGKR